MSVLEIKRELAKLPAEERRELTAFLVSLRHEESEGFKERMSSMIDDKNPENWMSLEDFDKKSKRS
ncbi:MAG: hypothetical protein NWT08_02745 [Akkermansiaceae bacterium]|jgi:hypothetical protein|nr:hypothetical protein [Akkermansiaceae bacterium]MDP4646322.1 hypothetical protein [Akkermansiaceae bacterium]MDP4721443.1 hypothetical protein [Akkermansiaceae bacterium]MDP4779837.1 hypothetical protein [Akkermansiaceae bacterium]MDP4845803.1 hypothetical protein [Akkermansiaceae bacterium]